MLGDCERDVLAETVLFLVELELWSLFFAGCRGGFSLAGVVGRIRWEIRAVPASHSQAKPEQAKKD